MSSEPYSDTIISSLDQFAGPTLAGTIVSWFGFEGLIVVTACLCFAYAPAMLLLRKPPIFNETQVNRENTFPLLFVSV